MLAASFNTSDDPASDYEVLERIGQGSFGEVLKARHMPTGKTVALKKVLLRKPEAGLPDNVLREIKLLQMLNHTNVVYLHEVFPEGSSLVLALEFCATDLAQILRLQPETLDPPIIKGIMLQILRGLAACHAALVLHRDLKPSNVLLAADGTIKLADFGLARRHDNSGKYTHTVATRWYRAPELLYGARKYGPGVDLWAAGVIFGELLGKSPLIPGDNDIDQLYCVIKLLGTPKEENWPELKSLPDYSKISFPEMSPTPLEQVLPDSPPEAIRMLKSLVQYNPERRPSAEELLLDPYFFQDPLPALPGDIPQSGPSIANIEQSMQFDAFEPLSIEQLNSSHQTLNVAGGHCMNITLDDFQI
mmetsp:Transcript_22363/g.26937  ORF Transcript_22363/g.26937 Transcript_22363/m.26937 type:complete len:361 (+) Transcript_22363:883-1965(+)|eukprot:CAMPEP_0197846768 /NCGR_PEP_ID=MMETSP1438-20131217/4340_1 /TAXON_ID=1461541 /ORGANISM="Pterosperma sp., Strain CCMP1384" /LENGTH=360 /DNA_ID=CAMNT_0043458529 /DNA_START=882 /DNA_END=1964 /DNA_ORIENTATION=-